MANMSIDTIRDLLLLPTVLGSFGGLGLFLFSLKNGHYRNNRLIRKLLIELCGGALVATFVGPIFPEKAVSIGSFCAGLTWAGVIQVLRNKITKIVKALIGEEFK